jgi:cell pole-organizing protein PopZ
MSGVFSRKSSQPPRNPPPPATEADPSMEDILASIRRILNEGETESAGPAVTDAEVAAVVAETAPHATETVAPVAETHEPASAAAADPIEAEDNDDVFELDTDMMVADTATMPAAEAETPIASTEASAAASQSVSALKKALSERAAQIYTKPSVSLEDVVREEVRPMLKAWLDAHLPAVVERLVRAEIERVVARDLL